MHNVRPYAELVKTKTGMDVTLEEIWSWLSKYKLERYFSNPTRYAQFKVSRPERLADWCFNVIAEKSMGQYWMYDYLAYVNKVFAAQAPTPESAPQREPGLSEFEYRVGEGRLLVCSFNFREGDPAARWLRARLADYAASDAFEPRLSLTSEQLRAVCEAPLKFGYIDTNRARNPNDPGSTVRSGDLAQP